MQVQAPLAPTSETHLIPFLVTVYAIMYHCSTLFMENKKYCKLHIIIAPDIGAFYMPYVRAVAPLHHILHDIPGAIGTYTIHMQ